MGGSPGPRWKGSAFVDENGGVGGEVVMEVGCFSEEERGDVGEEVEKMELKLERVKEELALIGVGWLTGLGHRPRGHGC